VYQFKARQQHGNKLHSHYDLCCFSYGIVCIQCARRFNVIRRVSSCFATISSTPSPNRYFL